MQFDVIRETLNITEGTKSGHFHGVILASLYQVGYLIGGVIAHDQWRHVLASLFTINQLHVYAFIQSALPDDVTCMASLCGVMLYPALLSCGVIYSVFGWFGSCLLTDCNRLLIIARSPPPARYSRANSVGGSPTPPLIHVSACLFSCSSLSPRFCLIHFTVA